MIISASAGAGHDGASRELASRLRACGFRTDCMDLADFFPLGLGRLLRGTYRGMLTRLPWVYGMLFAIGAGFSRAAPSTRALLRPIRPRVLRALPPDTRAVVSTYPVVSQLLGPLRRDGQLAVPVVTYLTDFAVNPIWVSPGVDLHCAAHDTTRAEALALGADRVRVVGRLVSEGFRPGTPGEKRRAREAFGLPPDERLALLVAGSWGVGEVAKTAAEIARTEVAVPVVVCGRNEALRRRLRRRGIGHVFGWVDDMPALLRAADVLVENAGGLTALEAMACGLPIATYRPIPGHGTANAATMARAGMATWVRRRAALGSALIELADGIRGRRQREAGLSLFAADPASVVADLARQAAPLPATRPSRPSRRRTRTAIAVVAAATLLAWHPRSDRIDHAGGAGTGPPAAGVRVDRPGTATTLADRPALAGIRAERPPGRPASEGTGPARKRERVRSLSLH